LPRAELFPDRGLSRHGTGDDAAALLARRGFDPPSQEEIHGHGEDTREASQRNTKKGESPSSEAEDRERAEAQAGRCQEASLAIERIGNREGC